MPHVFSPFSIDRPTSPSTVPMCRMRDKKPSGRFDRTCNCSRVEREGSALRLAKAENFAGYLCANRNGRTGKPHGPQHRRCLCVARRCRTGDPGRPGLAPGTRRPLGGGGARRRGRRHLGGRADHARPVRGAGAGRARPRRRPASPSARSTTSSPTRRATKRDPAKPWLLAPVDLQAIKAAGVTFAVSMLERVIEERTRGAPERAAEVRAEIGGLIGHDLAKPEARLAGGDGAEGPAHRQGHVVAISRGRHRPGRRDLHQGAAHGRRRPPRRGRHPSDVVMEQPGAGGGAGRRPRPGRSSAPRSATTSTCATSRAAPLCSSARPRTTTPAARSGRSSASSATASRSTTSAMPR